MAHIGLTTGQAAVYIGKHPKTLQQLDRRGVLPAKRTSTNRRYWEKADLDLYLGKTTADGPKKVVAYCRVSSQAQRPDLKNQRSVIEDFCLARGMASVEYVEEIKGGLNFKRPIFSRIMDEIEAADVKTLVIAHRDRLCRFGFEWFERHCHKHGCELLVLNTEKMSPEQEMVQDLMTIVHCFSARLYGLRNYRKALTEALKKK
jgi:predicted site-specific integrase-resolvase